MKHLILLVLSTLLAQTLSQKLVLLGSNLRDDNTVVWKKLVNLAGGAGVAQFGVISAVASSSTKTAESTKVIANLLNAGAKSAVAIPITKAGAFDGNVVNKVKNTTGLFIVEDTDVVAPASSTTSSCGCIAEFFFPAGEPSSFPAVPAGTVCNEKSAFNRKNLIDTLRPVTLNDSTVLSAIRSIMITKGVVVAGNAAIMGNSPAILEGDAISSLVVETRNFYSYPRKPLSLINRGLGLLNLSLIIESGISEQGREVRLMRALIESNITSGIGVDENTAFVVTNPFTAPVGEVIVPVGSTNGVTGMNISGIPLDGLIRGVYENITFSMATVNDTMDLKTGNITYASFKLFIPGDYFPTALASADILSLSTQGEWRNTARYLIDCAEMNVTSNSSASLMPVRPAVQVFMDRKIAVGYGNDMPDDPNLTYVASFSKMLATIKVLGISLESPSPPAAPAEVRKLRASRSHRRISPPIKKTF